MQRQVAQKASAEIEAWLRSLPQTQIVQNVEDNQAYQQTDVDLLWTTSKASYQVEIKSDRWHKTGNFFFETHSRKKYTRLLSLYPSRFAVLLLCCSSTIVYATNAPYS